MVYDPSDKFVIRDRAWAEVRQICNSEEKSYHELMGVPQQTANDWLNQIGKVPHVYLIKTEMLFSISIERLSPFTEEENKIFREWQRYAYQLHYRELSLNDIVIENIRYLPLLKENDRILVDNNGVLISGLEQLEAHKKNNKNKVKVFVVDIEALILELRSIKEMGEFSKSECMCIGYRVKQLIGSRKGQHVQSVNVKSEKEEANINNKAKDRTIRYELKSTKRTNKHLNETKDRTVRYEVKWAGLTNEHLAKILGFSGKNTYYRTDKVCQQGTPALINALNEGLFSIDRAFEISKSSQDEQNKNVAQAMSDITLKTTSTQRNKQKDYENLLCKTSVVYA